MHPRHRSAAAVTYAVSDDRDVENLSDKTISYFAIAGGRAARE